MGSLNTILFIAMILIFIFLISLKLFNTSLYSKVNVREINSADINISSSKVDQYIQHFLDYLKAKDIQVNYFDSNIYRPIHSMLNTKKKTINIPKWIMPSVGYELDYVFASIWYNVKLIQKDKEIKKYHFLSKYVISISIILYYALFIFMLICYFLYSILLSPIQVVGTPLEFVQNVPIIESFGIVFFIIFVTTIFLINANKTLLEAKYEREIVKFVDKDCVGYKNDISVARYYATSFPKTYFKIFRFSNQTTNLKYMGPFVIL